MTHTPLAAGASCADGNACNGAEACQAVAPSGCLTPPSGIASWWPGDGNATDIASGRNGTPVGGLGFGSGEVAQAFSFDGIDDYLDLSAYSAALASFTNAALEMWVSVPNDTCQTIFHMRQDSTHEQLLQVGNGCTATLSNELVTWTYVNGGTPTVLGYTTTSRSQLIGGNTFHHLAVNFASTRGILIYIDGVSRTISIGQGANNTSWARFSPITTTVGARFAGSPSALFQGAIDELTLYGTGLAAANVLAVFQAGSGGKCKGPGTIACAAGAPPNLDDSNPCTIDTCDPSTGILHAPQVSGTACNDANACTQSDACNSAGQCTGTPVNVDDGNACTVDSCSAGAISHQALSVDDGNLCTLDSCDPITGVHHDAIAVNDGNPCTADGCDPATGVVHTAAPSGASCTDGVFCNGAETCSLCTSADPDFRGWWPAEGHAANALGTGAGTVVGNVSY
ncbi:MAG: LamG-like jellyroll fold domain-containing protein, partial [Candidatus Nanopelagicales bacterium]